MSTLRGRTRVSPSGEFRIPVPNALVGRDVEYILTVNPASTTSGTNSAPLSQADWERVIRETAGSCPDFPDIERPGPESYEKRDEF